MPFSSLLRISGLGQQGHVQAVQGEDLGVCRELLNKTSVSGCWVKCHLERSLSRGLECRVTF